MPTIGDRIRKLRSERGLAQQKLADKVGISQSYLSDLERGIGNIDAEDLYKIALALGYPISAFYPQTDLHIASAETVEELFRYDCGEYDLVLYKRSK